jgi:flavin-dependent dehydrogenase
MRRRRREGFVVVDDVNPYDLIVVGAGPAGCAAAITAARNGASVLLLERGRFPRHKVCGEFVSAESLELLQELLTPKDRDLITTAPRIQQGRIFADGAEIHAEINPPAASITRFDLDAALWRSCAESGIAARQEQTVQNVKGTGPVTVKTQTDMFEAKAVVNATGRWSNLTSAEIRSTKARERWIGLKAHFREVSPPASVDLYFFDGGYCGVQPIPGGKNGSCAVNACAMVSARVATTISGVLRLHPALLERSREWEPLMEPVSTSPLVFHKPQPMQAGMLQVGDSATFVDPFIGDGISLALRSGALAAECLKPLFRESGRLAEAAAEYCKLYEERLAHVFRASSMLRRMLAWPMAVRKPVLGLLQRTPRLTKRLVGMTR